MAAPQGAQAQQAEGERLFRQRCAACHSLDADGRGAGPSLAGILGREAASLDGVRYSGALSDSGLTWDAETLDQFLSNPGELVPGTTMRVRISNQAQREAIIRFLEGA
ncbi:MAG: c-type cytochrome [Rhodobacteraceae bacterium]|nr:c-type cytochrome [Paracoccaceae bacterium]MBR9822545.1 c-type cytochrome [Paracoccaceae bacterium]